MNKYLFNCLLALIFINTALFSQNIRIPNNALFKTILAQKQSITHITPSTSNIIPVNGVFKSLKQQLLYTDKGLFLLIDATGQIFKATNWDDAEIEFKRIDSTSYFGFNAESLKIMRKDTIFSFGGYGFWRFNGYLSYFDFKRYEWEISLLNDEIPFFGKEDLFTSLYWINPKHTDIYFSEVILKNHGVKYTKQITNYLYKLNIDNREVKKIGKLNLSKEEISHFTKTRKTVTPFGVLYDNPKDDNSDYLIDYVNNRILIGNYNFIQKIIASKNNLNQNLFFYRNGFIYSSCFPFEKVDSTKLDISNFKISDQPLFSPIIPSNSDTVSKKVILYIGILILIALIILILFLKRKSRSTKYILNEYDADRKMDIKDFNLNALEKELLKEFIEKIENKGHFTVDDLNAMLGVSNKTIEVKKKARTEFITKVNFKMKYLLSIDHDILERKRSEIDKRSYLYLINKENIDLLKDLIFRNM